MKIAILGWGSLIWNQRDLPIVSEWQPDGSKPWIEFALHLAGPGASFAHAVAAGRQTPDGGRTQGGEVFSAILI